MFLQETKTKRGGKTYISYLVRESFRTANGPRGRTICNLTHLPREVREMVAHALRGRALVPLERLEINNIQSCGGCVTLDDAARRYGLPDLLAPLTPRGSSLIRAMIFSGLLNAPSAAPFHVEAHASRLAAFCGLDAEKERFDPADLTAALRELDERWSAVCALLQQARRSEPRAVMLVNTALPGENGVFMLLGMDAEGIPVPIQQSRGSQSAAAVEACLQALAAGSRNPPPLLALDEETATRLHAARLKKQPWLVELGHESLADLLRQLNPAQLTHALRTARPVEVRHHGERYILLSTETVAEAQEPAMRVASLKDLAPLATGRHAEPPVARSPAMGALHGVMTNLPSERLSGATALEWAARARTARAAFAPVLIVRASPAPGEGALPWRNDRNLQFLTHWMRCRLHGEWSARGESRPVEEVLRDLQEVQRATLTVDGVIVRRLATHPSNAVSALLSKLGIQGLFETQDGERKA